MLTNLQRRKYSEALSLAASLGVRLTRKIKRRRGLYRKLNYLGWGWCDGRWYDRYDDIPY